MECPFCGTRLATSYARCPHCYKSLMLYFPDFQPQTPDPASPVRTEPIRENPTRGIVLGVSILVLVLLFFLVLS